MTAYLYDYQSGDCIRPATPEEEAACIEAAADPPHTGAIEVDGRSCFVA